MNFDQVYEKYINGTATEKEKAYIESEIAKARKLSEIIDRMDAQRVIEPADADKVRKAAKTMKKKFGLRVLIISISALLVLALVAVGSVAA